MPTGLSTLDWLILAGYCWCFVLEPNHRGRIVARWHLARSQEVGALLHEGLVGLQERYDIVGSVRGLGLMQGIELSAPSSRVGRLSWRLMQLASEGLFPQLVVIPLHREHGVITMAAAVRMPQPLRDIPPSPFRQARCSACPSALHFSGAPGANQYFSSWLIVSSRRPRREKLRGCCQPSNCEAISPCPRK